MLFGAHYLPTYVAEADGPPAEFYRRMFQQMRQMDALGYHSLWVTEHHFHEYGGTLPDPAAFLSAVAVQTERIRLGIAIVVLPLHNPLQVAESYGMVDVMSGGRLELGIGRGTGAELQQFGIGYEDSSLRLREGAAIIRQAWSQEAVDFHGKLYDYRGMRVLPRTPQRPHPPIWVAASRSDDTYRWAGENGFHLLTLPPNNDTATLRQNIEHYRQALERAGHDPSTRQVLGKFMVYVAPTERAAVEECMPFLQTYRALAGEQNQTPTVRRRREVEELIEQGKLIVGDPARCIEVIRYWQQALGLTVVTGTFYFGGMPQGLALQNITLFADQVMPAFREPALPAGEA